MSIPPEELSERLKAMQETDLSNIGRRDDLGAHFHLDDARPGAERTQSLLKEVPLDLLSVISDSMRNQVAAAVDAFERELGGLAEFDPTNIENAAGARTNLINSVNSGFEQKFNQLHPIIAYASSRRTDLSALDREARKNMTALDARVNQFDEDMQAVRKEADELLEAVKQAAEEQGVSQQAHFFKTIADDQDTRAKFWLKMTVGAGGVVFLFAMIGIVAPHIGWLNWFAYEPSQPIAIYLAAKAVFFIALIFGLYSCARNFFAHKHNALINRQRQTALQTFRVLADAARNDADRDVILTHAAACIFQPQDTGFVRSANEVHAGQSVIEIMRGSSSSA